MSRRHSLTLASLPLLLCLFLTLLPSLSFSPCMSRHASSPPVTRFRPISPATGSSDSGVSRMHRERGCWEARALNPRLLTVLRTVLERGSGEPPPICAHTRQECANNSPLEATSDRHEVTPSIRAPTCTCLLLRTTRFTACSTTIDVYTHGCARVFTYACTNARARVHGKDRDRQTGRADRRPDTGGERATHTRRAIGYAHNAHDREN